MRKELIFFVLIALCLMFMGQNSDAITLEDTLGIWLFDEGKGEISADSSRNGNNAKLLNGVKWIDGMFGKGIDFDGSDDLVRVELPNVTLNSWAVIAWIYPRNPALGHYQGIVQAWPNQGEFQIQNNSGAIGVHNVYGGTLIANEWSHVAAVVDNNNVQVYINGKVVTKGAVGTVIFAKVGMGDLYECPAGFNYKFDGQMDEVAIFNKAISDNDVNEIMNKGIGKIFGLIAVFPEDKIAGTWGNIKAVK